MPPFSRETSLEFHRQAAENEARLIADLVRIFDTILLNRKRYDAAQDQLYEELKQRIERRHYSEEEISEALTRLRQGYEEGY